jgi:hypothetical protein
VAILVQSKEAVFRIGRSTAVDLQKKQRITHNPNVIPQASEKSSENATGLKPPHAKPEPTRRDQ